MLWQIKTLFFASYYQWRRLLNQQISNPYGNFYCSFATSSYSREYHTHQYVAKLTESLLSLIAGLQAVTDSNMRVHVTFANNVSPNQRTRVPL